MGGTETVFVDVESFRVSLTINSKGKIEESHCSCDDEEPDIVIENGIFGLATLDDICMHQKAALSEVYSRIEHEFDVQVHF